MAISLYDLSVPSYLQILNSISGFLAKGQTYFTENNIDANDIVETRLIGDMLPFRFQIISAAHHSIGAIEAIQSGVFNPPGGGDGLDYAGLQKLVDDTRAKLQLVKADAVNDCVGKDMIFQLGKNQLPFITENFIFSFSLPNFYFHATTAYDILRQKGVPLGKRDFLGHMRMKM